MKPYLLVILALLAASIPLNHFDNGEFQRFFMTVVLVIPLSMLALRGAWSF